MIQEAMLGLAQSMVPAELRRLPSGIVRECAFRSPLVGDVQHAAMNLALANADFSSILARSPHDDASA